MDARSLFAFLAVILLFWLIYTWIRWDSQEKLARQSRQRLRDRLFDVTLSERVGKRDTVALLAAASAQSISRSDSAETVGVDDATDVETLRKQLEKAQAQAAAAQQNDLELRRVSSELESLQMERADAAEQHKALEQRLRVQQAALDAAEANALENKGVPEQQGSQTVGMSAPGAEAERGSRSDMTGAGQGAEAERGARSDRTDVGQGTEAERAARSDMTGVGQSAEAERGARSDMTGAGQGAEAERGARSDMTGVGQGAEAERGARSDMTGAGQGAAPTQRTLAGMAEHRPNHASEDGGMDIAGKPNASVQNSSAAEKARSGKAPEKVFTPIFQAPLEKDDLKKIKGIGPVMERTLNALGVTTFQQLADFTQEDIDKVSEAIDAFPGRIERDDWVGKAGQILQKNKSTA